MFVVQPNGNQAIVNWGYNAWGGKYPPFDLDNSIPSKVAEALGIPLIEPEMILEGGSIDVNGNQSLITTEQCMLNTNRNPNLDKQEIESRLSDFMGVKNITWLGNGIKGDDTDGHVDNISRFVSKNTVVTAVEENISDPNHEILQHNQNVLKKKFNIIELPMPRKIEYQGQRLPASYANFYICNSHIIVPTYRDTNDDRAIETLKDMFPKRKVTGLDSIELIWGLGSFHCLTQQQPA